jgi:hypothetical protein
MDRNLRDLYVYVLKYGWRINGYRRSDAYPGTMIIDLKASVHNKRGISIILKPNEA